jgi:undecaprenyl-diphosphatase
MSITDSILLGIIQGITEFLPISSSGHLVILQDLMGIETQGVFFEVVLHFGTLVSIFLVYYSDISEMFKEAFGLFNKMLKARFNGTQLTEYESLILYIVAGSIPTAFIGFVFEDYFEKMFSSTHFVGLMLIITGFMLMLSRRFVNLHKNFENMSLFDAIVIGSFQGLAIAPGISRAGSTIFASLFRGLKREKAVKYSFLLSVPAVLGANVFKLKEITQIDIKPMVLIAGVLTAAVSGYVVIKVLTKILKQGKFYLFSYYCWLLGITIILMKILD